MRDTPLVKPLQILNMDSHDMTKNNTKTSNTILYICAGIFLLIWVDFAVYELGYASGKAKAFKENAADIAARSNTP